MEEKKYTLLPLVINYSKLLHHVKANHIRKQVMFYEKLLVLAESVYNSKRILITFACTLRNHKYIYGQMNRTKLKFYEISKL